MRGVCPYCSLNHSSHINVMFDKLSWESHTDFPMDCVKNKGSAYTAMRSVYMFGVDDSSAPKAKASWIKSTMPDCEMTRLPVLVKKRNAYAMIVDLEYGRGNAIGGVLDEATTVGGFLYTSTVGTDSCALSLISIGSS